MFEKLTEMIVSGFIGNYSYDRIRRLLKAEAREGGIPAQETDPEEGQRDPDIKAVYGQNVKYKKKYRTFDIQDDFEVVLDLLAEPVVYIVIEDRPSMAWRLPVIIAEDAKTGEWYVFSKGRVAFEGAGGGLSQAKTFLKKIQDKDVPFSAWVLEYALTEKLSQGCRPWPEFKLQCIPALAAEQGEYFREFVIGSLQEVAKAQ
ncbi:hypothetical protein [Vreelandella lionensis]|uniref:hypothetical protein n=1 Tax=Halomonadaceae TaxID=28256 RepID=UPI0009F5E80E|nr:MULTISPECIES: hypothetical protein [Halomonas]MCP1319510.1 hypothetical protein [Halomonas sp. 707B3]